MKEEKKEVVKKFRFKKFLIVILLLYLFGFFIYQCLLTPIKNIFISNNNYLTDQELIDEAGLKNYPSFFFTAKSTIRKKLLKDNLIESATIKKKLFGKIYIDIIEKTPLFYDKSKNKVILNDGTEIDKSEFVVPILINYVEEEVYDKLITKMATLNNDIILMISEIEYVPNNIDTERFILTMNDGNYIYMTLTKISSVNEYLNILPTLEGKNGILYLDSGNYFEIFE